MNEGFFLVEAMDTWNEDAIERIYKRLLNSEGKWHECVHKNVYKVDYDYKHLMYAATDASQYK